MTIDKFMIFGSNAALSGSDTYGSFTMSGTIIESSGQVSLTKTYGGDTISYTGRYSNGVISGQWKFGDNVNEFVFFEKGKAYTSSEPTYGAGCKYSSKWTGPVGDGEGTTFTMTLTNFSIDSDGYLSADTSDQYGPGKLTGYVRSQTVTLQKLYDGVSDPITYDGVLNTKSF